MSRKRRIFDLDMPDSADIPVGKIPDSVLNKRRGPMAAAISENAESVRERQSAASAIRDENDRLAHDLVRLKKQGLIVDLVRLGDVVAEKLVRDRKPGPDPELEDLKTSIRDIGLSNPIRVEPREDGRFELVQGMRRLTAYRELLAETGDARFETIPAGIVTAGDPVETSYRRMVDENMIRKDISFAEMGALARAYAVDPENNCAGIDKAVAVLFKSASYTKRSYIRAFASLVMQLEKVLEHPNEIPRNVGVALKRRMDNDISLMARVVTALQSAPGRDSEAEVAILRRFATDDLGAIPQPVFEGAGDKPARKSRKAKTTFEVGRQGQVAKCAASAGRVELRYDLDFSTVDRRKLEQAVAAFLDALEGD